ncbi:MAG: VOC family protein [Opitutales bacterium]|nr:VOC family protein [Opitutales bacterium]
MQVNGTDFVLYEVNDFEKAVDFYQNTLGLPLTWKEESFDWAEFDAQQTTIGVYNPQKAEGRAAVPGGMVFLAVNNVHDTLMELKEKGVTILFGPIDSPVCEMGGILDPFGNRVGIHHRKDGSVG